MNQWISYGSKSWVNIPAAHGRREGPLKHVASGGFFGAHTPLAEWLSVLVATWSVATKSLPDF